MKRIFLIGPPGSGKTYLSGKISEKLNIDKFSLDDIFWVDVGVYSQKEDPKIRDRKFNNITNADSWVAEGAYYEWIKKGLECSDKIIILKGSVILRTCRVIRRSLIDRIRGERKESFYSLYKMIKWGIRYNKTILPEIFRLTEDFENKRIVLNSKKEINNYLVRLH